MRVVFWGTRGSLPATVSGEQVQEKLVTALLAAGGRTFADRDAAAAFLAELPFAVAGCYGTNTSCTEIQGGDECVICDAGSGLRDCGNSYMRAGGGPRTYHLLLSHLHWDHLQGFPFFVPAYVPGNTIHVYGGHEELETALRTQQMAPFFPVPLSALGANIQFHRLHPGQTATIAGFEVSLFAQNHPGTSYGYCFRRDGVKIVYSTDAEHKADSEDDEYPFLDFIHGADLLVFDAQYTLFDAVDVKEDWGHASNITGVELAVKARVKHLCLYHSEPTNDDAALDTVLANTRDYAAIHAPTAQLVVSLAYDGLAIDVRGPFTDSPVGRSG